MSDRLLSVLERAELHEACALRLALVIQEDIGFPHIELHAGESLGELALGGPQTQVANVHRGIAARARTAAVLVASLILGRASAGLVSTSGVLAVAPRVAFLAVGRSAEGSVGLAEVAASASSTHASLVEGLGLVVLVASSSAAVHAAS